MKKSQRIQTIVDIKAQQEQKSLEALGEKLRSHQEAIQQLEHLVQYRQEYLDKFQNNASVGMSVTVLVDFRAFIEKLDQAIAGQAQLVQQAELEVMNKRKNWENKHQHTQSLQKVFDGIVAEEHKLENKREQAESDDRSSRSTRGQSMNGI